MPNHALCMQLAISFSRNRTLGISCPFPPHRASLAAEAETHDAAAGDRLQDAFAQENMIVSQRAAPSAAGRDGVALYAPPH